MRRSPNWQSNTLRGYRMLLKDFYIDQFTKKIKAVEPPPTSEYNQGLVDGLEYAIKVMQDERSPVATQQ
jgi:hypothetical protein